MEYNFLVIFYLTLIVGWFILGTHLSILFYIRDFKLRDKSFSKNIRFNELDLLYSILFVIITSVVSPILIIVGGFYLGIHYLISSIKKYVTKNKSRSP